jgi:hypothetical protein
LTEVDLLVILVVEIEREFKMTNTKKDKKMSLMYEDAIAIAIDINLYKGSIPNGFDLVVYEKGEDEWLGTDASLKAGGPLQLFLYGFDEVGEFDHEFKTPAYAFVRH